MRFRDVRCAFSLLLALQGGCMSVHYVKAQGNTSPRPTAVAVLELASIAGAYQRAGIGNLVEEGCLSAVMEASVRPVEGRQISRVLQERMDKGSEKLSGADFYKAVGRLSGAEAFIAGTVTASRRGDQVESLTLRLVSSARGEILSSATVDSVGRSPQEMGARACRALLSEGTR